MTNASIEEFFPENWTLATIGELISSNGLFVDGDWIESKDQDLNGEVRLIKLADIGDGYFKDKSTRFLNFEIQVLSVYFMHCQYIVNLYY